MGLLSRAMRKVSLDDLPIPTRLDLAAWTRQPDNYMLHTFGVDDVAEHWAENADDVARYAAMDTPIPPILVRGKGGKLVIVDGNHRYNAALRRGQTEFDAINLDDLE